MADPSSLSGLQDRLSLWESRLEKLQAFCDRDRQLLAAHQSPTRGIPTLNLTWPAVAPVLLDRAIPTNRTEHLLETKRDEHLEQVEDDGSGGQADVLGEFEKPSAVSPQFADADAATLPSRNQESPNLSPNSHVSSFLAPTDSGNHTAYGFFRHHMTSSQSRFGVDMSTITFQSDRRRLSSLASPASEPEIESAAKYSTPIANAANVSHSQRFSTVRRHVAPDVTVPHLRSSIPSQPPPVPAPTLQDIVTSPAHVLPPPVPQKVLATEPSTKPQPPSTCIPTGCTLQSPFALPAVLDSAIPSYVLTTLHGYEAAIAIEQGGHTLTYKRMTTLIRLGAAGLARAGLAKGDAVCIHCGNVPLFPVAVMAIVAIGGCASLGGYDDVVAASTGSNSSLQQLSAYYRRIQPKAVIVPPQFTAVVAAALMNAGRTAAVFTLSGTNADMGSRGTKSRPSFTHPAITYVRSMHSLFTGGVEGFPAKVKLNIYKDMVMKFYGGAAELSSDSTHFAFTHCSFVRTLACGIASTSRDAVSHSRRLLQGPSGAAMKNKRIMRDVVSDVASSLAMLSPTMVAPNDSEWWEGDDLSVSTSITTPVEVAVYQRGATVLSESSWSDVFGFMWGLWIPLMSGCKLTCESRTSDSCDVLVSHALPSGAGSPPQVVLPASVLSDVHQSVGCHTTIVWSNVIDGVPTHIAHLVKGAAVPAHDSLGLAMAGVQCRLLPVSGEFQSRLLCLAAHGECEKAGAITSALSDSQPSWLHRTTKFTVSDTPHGLRVHVLPQPQQHQPVIESASSPKQPPPSTFHFSVSLDPTGRVSVQSNDSRRVSVQSVSGASVGSSDTKPSTAAGGRQLVSYRSNLPTHPALFSRAREASLERSRASVATRRSSSVTSISRMSEHQKASCNRLSRPTRSSQAKAVIRKPLYDVWPFNN